jgi:DNA ligase D-like protein (predicted ligase)
MTGQARRRFASAPRPASTPSRLPQIIEPMLPATAAEPFDSPAHIFEVLWDGVRAFAFVESGGPRLHDRFGRDITHRYPELQDVARQVTGTGLVLDGQIVSLDGRGRPDFGALRARLSVDDGQEAKRLAARSPVTFHAFDLLYLNGENVMGQSLRRRKELLRQEVRHGPALTVPDFVAKDGIAFFEAAREHDLGGIIAKECDSRYLPGQRSRAWLAIRLQQRSEFVIAGFTYGGRWRKPGARPSKEAFASLLLAAYGEDDRLHYAGEVTGDFDEINRPETASVLDHLVTNDCPLAEAPPLDRLVFWCRPEMAATVRFAEWTADGRLRFPVFMYLRPDVPPESCRLGAGAPP